jgi:hypothetical protein
MLGWGVWVGGSEDKVCRWFLVEAAGEYTDRFGGEIATTQTFKPKFTEIE